ncbi:hypothetical protein BGZ89_008078 [Linnemannia elongata]|nr:hypothetical protein BGZ89_008078 [Linnemannia elongata]
MWLWHLVWRGTEQEWEHVLVIGKFLIGISCAAWKPDKLEFVAGSSSGIIQVWRLVEELHGSFSARLMWTSGRTVFTVTNAVIIGAVGLSETNQMLLKQRGAMDGTEVIEDNLLDDSDESQDEYSDEDQADYSNVHQEEIKENIE